MNSNLIVPVAKDFGDSDMLPYIFGLTKEGFSICVNSILGIDLKKFDNIYFSILQKHDEKFKIKKLLELQFERLNIKNAECIILQNSTLSEPDTIYQTIRTANISGSIFIKDAHSFFVGEVSMKNGLAIASLEDEKKLVDVQNKSFVAVDDSFFITNIIEKKILGKYFSAGGYSFSDAEVFCSYLKKIGNEKGLYLSHIVYAMLLDKKNFIPIIVKDYKDWGNSILRSYYANDK